MSSQVGPPAAATARGETGMKRLRTLLVLLVLLSVAVLGPTIDACAHLLFWQAVPIIQGQKFSAPTGWLASKKSEEFQLWKPCLTIFCRSGNDSIKLQHARIHGDMETWSSVAEEVLIQQGYQRVTRVETGGGKIKFNCLQAVKNQSPASVISICYDPILDVQATFKGSADNLQLFRTMIERAAPSVAR